MIEVGQNRGMTASPPTVSVLMPVRNGARWLDEAVASVLAQSWTDLELVVVDDASLDVTPEMLRTWCERDPRVRVLRRAVATGTVAARREAVAAARGPLLAMLDADDVAAPDRLRRQVAEMATRPALVLLGTGARYVDADGNVFMTERATAGPDVAGAADHERLPPPCRHHLRPAGLVLPSRPVQVFQRPDVVDLDVLP